MGNCLVTKLQESVNNDNLRQLGGIIVTFKDLDENPSIVFYISGSYSVKAKSGRFNILNSTTTDVVAANLTDYAGSGSFCITPAQANTVVEVTSKYDINGIGYNIAYTNPDANHVVVNTSDLNYGKITAFYNNNAYTRIRYSEGTLDLGTVSGISNATDISIPAEGRYTALRVIVPESIVFGSSLTRFDITNGIAGLDDRKFIDLNLTSFHHAVNLNNLNIPLSSLVRGDIKELFDALYANGKVSGSLDVYGVVTQMTYDGNPLDNDFWLSHNYKLTATFTQSGWTSNY